MPMLSSVHQLFSADQCQAYIHALRWKDRPLQCPRCQSHNVGPWGTYHYRPGVKRYWCHGCRRTFNDLTYTLLAQSQRSLPHWILATFLLCLSCSSQRIAREVGVHVRTGYRWCWWLRNAALSYEMQRQLEGTVEADELYHTAGNKGQALQGGKKSLGRRPRSRRKKLEPGRGHYDKDRPAMIAWISRQGLVVVRAVKDFTVKTVQQAADLAVQAGSRLYTDSASSYQALQGYRHEFVNRIFPPSLGRLPRITLSNHWCYSAERGGKRLPTFCLSSARWAKGSPRRAGSPPAVRLGSASAPPPSPARGP